MRLRIIAILSIIVNGVYAQPPVRRQCGYYEWEPTPCIEPSDELICCGPGVTSYVKCINGHYVWGYCGYDIYCEIIDEDTNEGECVPAE